MMIEPDSLHEGEDGIYLDCPKCGSNVSLGRIVSTGRCSNSVDGEVTDAAEGPHSSEGDCDARLSLELVWES